MKTPAFDIFQVQDSGVLWVGSALTVEEAQQHVRQIAGFAPGEYLLLNQNTGNRLVIKSDGGHGAGLSSGSQAQRDSQ
jgi:hypothetical protein